MTEDNAIENTQNASVKEQSVSKTKRDILKGPKEGQVVTAKFSGKSKQLFDNLKKTKILVLISVKNNESCTGEYFDVTAHHAISTYGFTTFLIVDEVYWHNLKNEKFTRDQEMQLKQQATDFGSEWFENNLGCFLKLVNITLTNFNSTCKTNSASGKIERINEIAIKENLNFEIVRWKDWINNKKTSYAEKSANISKMYQIEHSLIKSVEASAQKYSNRQKSTQESDLCFANSKDYLIEESPGIMCVAAALGYNFIAYAGNIIESFQATHDYFIVDNKSINKVVNSDFMIQTEDSKRIANWLNIKFTRGHNPEQKKPSLMNNDTKTTSTISSNQYYNNNNNPYLHFQSSSPPKSTALSDSIYGITKAILDYPMNNQMKVDFVVAVTLKLLNLSENNTNTSTQPDFNSTLPNTKM